MVGRCFRLRERVGRGGVVSGFGWLDLVGLGGGWDGRDG